MRIAVLTSGGDAPGMNALLINLYQFLKIEGHETLLIKNGFFGLVNAQFYDVKKLDESKRFLAGSFLKSTRFKEFKEKENQLKAIDVLKQNQVDALIVIGGDGSYQAVKALRDLGVNTHFVPASIDNDMEYNTFTLGFDSALNEIVNDLKKIVLTFQTSGTIAFVEVMGRDCSDLVVGAAQASWPALVLPDSQYSDFESITNRIKDFYDKHQYAIVLIKEKYYSDANLREIISYVSKTLNVNVRLNIIGYLQRGAHPTAFDLNYAYLSALYLTNHIQQKNLTLAYDAKIIAEADLSNTKSHDYLKAINNLNKHLGS